MWISVLADEFTAKCSVCSSVSVELVVVVLVVYVSRLVVGEH